MDHNKNKTKSVFIAFLANPYYDTRILNLFNSLRSDGFQVRVTGFSWLGETTPNDINEFRIHLLQKGKFSLNFYFYFVLRLLGDLRKFKANIYFAEDIYTLPFVVFFAKLNRGKVFYDSRELYGYLGGLRKRKLLQSIISGIEKFFIRKVNLVLTTGEMDAQFLRDYYKITNISVLRNLPGYIEKEDKVDLRKLLSVDKKYKILVYQGVLLEGRGIQIIIETLKELRDCVFVLIGEGVFRKKFQKIAAKSGVSDRIFFLGIINNDELLKYTRSADIGLAVIENISKSYYYALPNKLFEYIMAGIPVIVSNLPQMEKIIKDYRVGEIVDPENKESIVSAVEKLTNDSQYYSECRNNCLKAARDLNWEKEYASFKEVFYSMK